jgi:VEFS-Box of polycomb protein
MIILWNDFINRTDTIIPAKRIPQLCVDFIKEHAFSIRDSQIDEQLRWHLVTLWDEGLISNDHLSSCLDYYHGLVDGSNDKKRR